MTTQEILDIMIENPIIAACRSEKTLDEALKTDVKIVFMLSSTIGEVKRQCEKVVAAGKLVFLHVDLVEGLRPDAVGIRYIAETVKPTGIITTKGPCIKMAHDAGMFAIQRVFMLDSASMRSGVQNAATCKPDFVEILPGMCLRAIEKGGAQMSTPIIAGGFIESREDVIATLKAGAVAASSSCSAIWGE